MKTLSIILTTLLILPIGYQLFSDLQSQLIRGPFEHSQGIDPFTWRLLSYLLIDVFFLITAIVLNIKEKYLENSIMCGTLLVSSVLSVMITFADTFLFNWLK